jgi:ABC-type transporter lipoprotein component MlaA
VGGSQLVRPAIRAGEVINTVSLNPDVYPDMKKQAVDPYTFIRDVYHQNREKKVAE